MRSRVRGGHDEFALPLDYRRTEGLSLSEQAAAGFERRGFIDVFAARIVLNTVFAYEEAREWPKAELWRRKWLSHLRQKSGPESSAVAGELAGLAANLLRQGRPVDAEPIARESLAIRERAEPDAWTTANSRSLLGATLVGQQKHAEAEPLLLQGYGDLKQRQDTIPAEARMQRLTEALDRLVQLYEAWGKPDEAAKWRAERENVG